jgi:hypothetical protein
MLRNVRPVNNPIAGQEDGLSQNFERIHLHHRDRQLCKMLFVQIIVYIIFTILYPVQTVYNATTFNIEGSKSEERIAIENFILFFTSSFLLNFYSAASFFVFLTSSAFRKALRKIFISIFSRHLRTHNQRQIMSIFGLNSQL